MECAGGESGPRRRFERQSSDSALGAAAELVYGGSEARRSSDGGGALPASAAAAADGGDDDPNTNDARARARRRKSGPAVAPLAFRQRDVDPVPPAAAPLAFEPRGAPIPTAAPAPGGPPVSQLLHRHAAGMRQRDDGIGVEYSQNLNDADVVYPTHTYAHDGPASRAAAAAEAGRRREGMAQDDHCYGQMNESSRTINVYESMMMAGRQQQPAGAHNSKNRAPRRKKRGANRGSSKKPAAQRAAEEEEEEYKRQREAYMSSNIYAMTSAGQEGGAGGGPAPQPGEEGYMMHTHTLALNDTPATTEGETIGRRVGRIARRMSFGALSAVSGLTGPGDSMYGDSSSSSGSSDDDEHGGGQRRYGGGINTMGKIGFDGPATGAWEGDMAPPASSGPQNEEEMMLQHHHAKWEKPKQWKPPEEPTLGRKIGRIARRMSGGAMSAGVLSALGGDSDDERAGHRRGQRKASSINLSTLARLDLDGLSDDHDGVGGQMNTDIHADARIAAEHGEIASAGGSAGNAVPFTIDVGSRGGRRQRGRRAGRRHSRGSYSPSEPTSLRDLPIFNAVGDINPGDVDVEAVQTTYYQDAREGARRAVKKGKKLARRMSNGSLSAMGFDMSRADDDDSDSSDDAPEPGDADYVPPSSADKRVRGKGGNGYAKIGHEGDDAVPSRGVRAPRRGSLANYIRVSARKFHDSGVGEFDPDNIVTIGMDDEAEEHELEMQKRRRISLCVAIGILVAVVAALAGGTAKVFMWWGPGSSSDNIGVIQQPGGLPEPPTDLDRVCSVRNMATEAGHKDCEKLCSPATCCMKSGEDSCYSEHESLCEKYSYCGTLYTYTETAYGDTATSDATSAEDLHITPPPANLDDICSDSSLETPSGYLDCLSTCHHGSCCVSLRSAQFGGEGEFGSTSVPSIQSCRDSHADICDAYEPCLKLWEAGHTDPVQIVKDVCTKKSLATTDGRDQCESLCRARSCCFAQDDRNCRVDNKNWCDEYSACEVLIDERPSTSAINYDGPAEPKASECHQSKITTSISLLMCEESCMVAACPCFRDLSDWNCGYKSTSDSNCKDWEYCRPLLANLVDDDENIGNGSTNNVKNNEILQSISSACSKDNINSSKGKGECFELCEDKMCCFGGCKDDADCGLYANCWNLLDTSDGGADAIEDGPKLRPPPDDLDELCDPSKLNQGMRQSQCKEACSIGQCCMGIGFSCQTNIKYCLQFAACDIIWEPELYSPAVGGKVPESSTESPIRKTCAPDSLKSPHGQDACDKACSEWSCCWDKNENCFDEHPNVCVEYMVCPNARRLL